MRFFAFDTINISSRVPFYNVTKNSFYCSAWQWQIRTHLFVQLRIRAIFSFKNKINNEKHDKTLTSLLFLKQGSLFSFHLHIKEFSRLRFLCVKIHTGKLTSCIYRRKYPLGSLCPNKTTTKSSLWNVSNSSRYLKKIQPSREIIFFQISCFSSRHVLSYVPHQISRIHLRSALVTRGQSPRSRCQA